MTESDRDDLARIIFTARPDSHWKGWEQTSEGIRAWCRAKADEAMAAGWRRVDSLIQPIHESVMYSLRSVVMFTSDEDTEAMSTAVLEAIDAALADPAGANGGG